MNCVMHAVTARGFVRNRGVSSLGKVFSSASVCSAAWVSTAGVPPPIGACRAVEVTDIQVVLLQVASSIEVAHAPGTAHLPASASLYLKSMLSHWYIPVRPCTERAIRGKPKVHILSHGTPNRK